jgi:hypothetical protein
MTEMGLFAGLDPGGKGRLLPTPDVLVGDFGHCLANVRITHPNRSVLRSHGGGDSSPYSDVRHPSGASAQLPFLISEGAAIVAKKLQKKGTASLPRQPGNDPAVI